MAITIKFDNRKQSIAFFEAFGMKHTTAALKAAEYRENLIQEAQATHDALHQLYQVELNKKPRDWEALERLGRLKGKAFERLMRRNDTSPA